MSKTYNKKDPNLKLGSTVSVPKQASVSKKKIVSVPKKKYLIINIIDGHFILLDENNNGIKMLISKEHKNAKIGTKILMKEE